MSTFLSIAIVLFIYAWCAFGVYGLWGISGVKCFLLWSVGSVVFVTLDDYFFTIRKKSDEIRRQKADELVYRLKKKGWTLSDLIRKIEEDKWKQVQKRVESRKK